MDSKDEDRAVTVLTCKGDIHDPCFPAHLQNLVCNLHRLVDDGRGRGFEVTKVEPWNSVRLTFNIPKEAARRLRTLAQAGDEALRELGILSVQVEEDQIISLTLTDTSVLSNLSNNVSPPSSSPAEVMESLVNNNLLQPSSHPSSSSSPSVIRIDGREEGGTGPPDKLLNNPCTVNVAQYSLPSGLPSSSLHHQVHHAPPSLSVESRLPSSSSYPSPSSSGETTPSSSNSINNNLFHVTANSLASSGNINALHLPSMTESSDVQKMMQRKSSKNSEEKLAKERTSNDVSNNSINRTNSSLESNSLSSLRKESSSSIEKEAEECNILRTQSTCLSSSSPLLETETDAMTGTEGNLTQKHSSESGLRSKSVSGESRVDSIPLPLEPQTELKSNGPTHSSDASPENIVKDDEVKSQHQQNQCTDHVTQYLISSSSSSSSSLHPVLNHVESVHYQLEAIPDEASFLRQPLLSCNKLRNNNIHHQMKETQSTSEVMKLVTGNNNTSDWDGRQKSFNKNHDTLEVMKSVSFNDSFEENSRKDPKDEKETNCVPLQGLNPNKKMNAFCSTSLDESMSVGNNNCSMSIQSQKELPQDFSQVNCVISPEEVTLNPSLRVTEDESSPDQTHINVNGTHDSKESFDSFAVVSGSSSASSSSEVRSDVTLDLLDPQKKLRDESNSVASGDHNYISVSNENSLQANHNEEEEEYHSFEEDFADSFNRHSDLIVSQMPNKKRKFSGDPSSIRENDQHHDDQTNNNNNKSRKGNRRRSSNDISNNKMLKKVNGPEFKSLIQMTNESHEESSRSLMIEAVAADELMPGTEHIIHVQSLVTGSTTTTSMTDMSKPVKVRQRKNCKNSVSESGSISVGVVPSTEKKRKPRDKKSPSRAKTKEGNGPLSVFMNSVSMTSSSQVSDLSSGSQVNESVNSVNNSLFQLNSSCSTEIQSNHMLPSSVSLLKKHKSKNSDCDLPFD